MKRLLTALVALLGLSACNGATLGTGFSISSPFNEHEPYGVARGGAHNGVDIATRVGTPIIAAADGVVANTGNYHRQTESCGNEITLFHPKLSNDKHEFETRYCHMSDLLFERGDVIKRGDVIGHVGQTGSSGSTTHVHFVTRVYSGNYIDTGGEVRRQFDPEKYVVGCYDPNIQYSKTKTEFTWPVHCKN